MRDLIVILGGCSAVALGVFGALRNRTIVGRAGSLFAAFVMCVGFAYFGWRPYFGGTNHTTGTYFGCLMLTFGIYAWLRFYRDSAERTSETTADASEARPGRAEPQSPQI